MDRILLHIANAVSVLGGLLAFVILFSGMSRSLGGEAAIGDYVLAGALAVVPYCFAGTLHRIVGIPDKPSD